jgi:hypothetical protein
MPSKLPSNPLSLQWTLVSVRKKFSFSKFLPKTIYMINEWQHFCGIPLAVSNTFRRDLCQSRSLFFFSVTTGQKAQRNRGQIAAYIAYIGATLCGTAWNFLLSVCVCEAFKVRSLFRLKEVAAKVSPPWAAYIHVFIFYFCVYKGDP